MSKPVVHPAFAPILTAYASSLPQGLLLSGDDGVGLLTIATYIARSHTKSIFTVIPQNSTITIEQIRELYALARTNNGPVAIIVDDSDTMGREASNALLKLLEEPGANIRFILTSHMPDALLPTIRSRVQTANVPRITARQTTDLLDAMHVTEPTKRSQLMFIANGLPAAITRLQADDDAFVRRSQTVRDARTFLGGSKEDRLVLSAGYGTDRASALGLVRDMMRLVELSGRTGVTDASVRTLETLMTAETDLRENSSVRLSLTACALKA